jgi:uncharacterized RDD family membrane protein YckC
MKTLQINTTQNVNINFTLANEIQRVGAFLIDNAIKIGYLLLMYSFVPSAGLEVLPGDYWTQRAIEIIVWLPVMFYSLYFEILMNGQTLGKRALSIRVVNIDGFKPSITDYIIRWFVRIIDFNLFIILGVYIYALGWTQYEELLFGLFVIGKCVGIVSVATSKKNQRLGDIAANTVVIALKDQARFSKTILENLAENYAPKYPNVIKLSDNDARIIKDTFTLAVKERDFKTLTKLKNKIEEVTQTQSLEKTDEEYIRIVLKDYNYYTQNM